MYSFDGHAFQKSTIPELGWIGQRLDPQPQYICRLSGDGEVVSQIKISELYDSISPIILDGWCRDTSRLIGMPVLEMITDAIDLKKKWLRRAATNKDIKAMRKELDFFNKKELGMKLSQSGPYWNWLFKIHAARYMLSLDGMKKHSWDRRRFSKPVDIACQMIQFMFCFVRDKQSNPGFRYDYGENPSKPEIVQWAHEVACDYTGWPRNNQEESKGVHEAFVMPPSYPFPSHD